MRQRIGIYFVVVVLVLTWPLHLGAASFLLTELIGDFFAPPKDHVLLWFPIAAAGGVLLILLVAGIFARRRLALYASALVLLAGLLTVSRFFPRPSVDWILHIYDWILCVGLTALFVLSAFYLFWVARHTMPVRRS